jgi:hypothetical protein
MAFQEAMILKEKLRIPGTSSLRKNSGIPGSFKFATKKSTVF